MFADDQHDAETHTVVRASDALVDVRGTVRVAMRVDSADMRSLARRHSDDRPLHRHLPAVARMSIQHALASSSGRHCRLGPVCPLQPTSLLRTQHRRCHGPREQRDDAKRMQERAT